MYKYKVIDIQVKKLNISFIEGFEHGSLLSPRQAYVEVFDKEPTFAEVNEFEVELRILLEAFSEAEVE